PGLVRYDEVAAGAINHTLRFTVPYTRRGFVAPATHWASSISDPNAPPMGTRLRLKASFDISRFPADDQVILTALKRYGMVLSEEPAVSSPRPRRRLTPCIRRTSTDAALLQ